MSEQDFIFIDGFKHIKWELENVSDEEMLKRSKGFYEQLNKRRSIRQFSDKEVPFEVIENVIKTASTAPSGANKQPWTFCVVANPEIKRKIRVAAEEEERKNYAERMSPSWLKDLQHLGTDSSKPFLETAPYLIVVFKRIFELEPDGSHHQNYYVNESVGLACGMLIAAIHNAGLATLTHTPSPMRFLEQILDRPKNERAFLLLPVGYKNDHAYVPDIKRKKCDEILKVY